MRNLRICFTLTSGHFHRDFPAAARQFRFVSSKASVFRWLEYSLTFRFCAVQYQHGRYAHAACLKKLPEPYSYIHYDANKFRKN